MHPEFQIRLHAFAVSAYQYYNLSRFAAVDYFYLCVKSGTWPHVRETQVDHMADSLTVGTWP